MSVDDRLEHFHVSVLGVPVSGRVDGSAERTRHSIGKLQSGHLVVGPNVGVLKPDVLPFDRGIDASQGLERRSRRARFDHSEISVQFGFLQPSPRRKNQLDRSIERRGRFALRHVSRPPRNALQQQPRCIEVHRILVAKSAPLLERRFVDEHGSCFDWLGKHHLKEAEPVCVACSDEMEIPVCLVFVRGLEIGVGANPPGLIVAPAKHGAENQPVTRALTGRGKIKAFIASFVDEGDKAGLLNGGHSEALRPYAVASLQKVGAQVFGDATEAGQAGQEGGAR